MTRRDIYIITKDGVNLFDSALGDTKKVDATLVSGFLSAVNSFVTEMGWPKGISLIRSGSLECRIWAGKQVFVAIIIDTHMILGYLTEPIVEDLAKTICERFEKKFPKEISTAINGKFSQGSMFSGFQADVKSILVDFWDQTFELYQKLILIEAMYANVPQKWCLPLIERLGAGDKDVTSEFEGIRRMYPQMKKAITKVNQEQAVLWDLIKIPLVKV